jgi:hypothetical protein
VKDFKFLFSDRAKRDCKKAKHNVNDELNDTVKKVLVLTPDRGEAISGFGILRKMRIAIPGQGFGKSSGYRLIYATRIIDETQYFIFLRVYFKSDMEDLTRSEYQDLVKLSRDIFVNWLDYTWDDFNLASLLEN